MKAIIVALAAFALPAVLLPAPAWGEARPAAGPAATTLKSVFINDPSFGRDPFFPNSSRRPLVPTNTVVDVVMPPVPTVPDDIFLKGINILKDRRLAIVNNYTVAQGEEFELKLKGKTYRVRCVEVKDRSAVIRIDGVNKEIPLRPGL
jgi:hypothetical protein